MENPTPVLMLNKPKGYLVSRVGQDGQKTVYELLPEWAFTEGWMPVGRLDLDSKGLLLFTQNSQLNDQLSRPRGSHKIYEVWVRGHVTPEHIKQAMTGIQTAEGKLRAVHVEITGGAGPKTKLEVELDEGKNRHIRRMFGALKDKKFKTPLKVLELKRIQIGGLKLNVESGKWRFLTKEEVFLLHAHLK
ncbi:MAG TPA: pseudouridine synthase [bacterium]|nr:pseudouridine synthase [bacterium]